MTELVHEKKTREIGAGDVVSRGALPELPPLFVLLQDLGRSRVCASGSGRKLRFFLNLRYLRHRRDQPGNLWPHIGWGFSR